MIDTQNTPDTTTSAGSGSLKNMESLVLRGFNIFPTSVKSTSNVWFPLIEDESDPLAKENSTFSSYRGIIEFRGSNDFLVNGRADSLRKIFFLC